MSQHSPAHSPFGTPLTPTTPPPAGTAPARARKPKAPASEHAHPRQNTPAPTGTLPPTGTDDQLDIDGAPDRPNVVLEVVPTKLVIANMIAVIVPLLGFLATAVWLWGWGFNAVQLGIFAFMYIITGFGITVGYHRLFTHKSFETSTFMKWVIGICGSMAVEGPIRKWVATHRRHHQHSDDHEDPHSPHHHGEDFFGVIRGFFHAHVGWLFIPDAPGLARYVPDLLKDKSVRSMSRLFPLWVFLGLLIPTVLGGLLNDIGTTGSIGWSWWGALLGYLWGGLARVFLVHHVTWSINSVCHVWGTRPFKSHDESRNNAIFGILGMGEGWHNNHHAFPTSARHGLRWWEIDTSYILIKTMALLGLVWDVKTPTRERIDAKRA